MIVTNTRSSAHTCAAQQDSHQLGRWNSITLKGKYDRYTTIISIYRPSVYQATYLRQTAYSAKRRKVVPHMSPNDLWYHDLSDLVTEKISQGHEVIVAGDFNDDLNDEKGKTRLFMKTLGLRELMIDRYGKGPATHIRGTKTIDGIFATSRIRITQGYYLTFEQSPSDHRWIVVDIDEGGMIGTSRNDLCPPLLRKATSKIPSVKMSFQSLVEQQVKTYNLRGRIHNLVEAIKDGKGFTETQARTYEAIEERMQRAIKYADSRCRKARRGTIPFSPLQHQLMGSILVLKQIKLRHVLKGQPNRPRTKKIQRLIAKYGYNGPINFANRDDIDKALSTAITKYNEFKGNANIHRWNYLEQLATELDEQDGKGKSHHYKVLYNREQTKEYFRRIRFCEGKSKGGGVDRVQVGDTQPPTIVYDKNRIEKEIMRANESKLLQAYDTPMRVPAISELLGEQGDFHKWEQILQGTITLPDGIDEGLLLWYTYITKLPQHTPMDFTWTPQEYIDSWKKMKEDKMTIPGIQVAHIKCLDAESDSAYVISTLALIPLMVGYSPKTWRIGIDSMIPKKVADLRPEKLRLILLMDARFNHNNKLIGKKMMEYGESHGLLAPEQFGSRKSKSAMEHATNKRVVMDIIRQSGTNGIYIANDAKSCYDRILLIVAYLTMRRFGVPSLVAKSTISTILHMKHFVRTRYGDSTDYYGGDKWNILPHGCGQGNGYGPALWACISSPLLNLLRKNGYGTRFQSPISSGDLHIAAFAFVDDVDIIQTSNILEDIPRSDVHSLYAETQQAIDQWTSTLRATGGELEPSKTFFVPIKTIWKGSKKSVEVPSENLDLHVKMIDGEIIPLRQHSPTNSFFTLGIWQSPSGDETKQVEYMTSKIRDWGELTNNNKLTWAQTRIAMRSTIGRTLHYPLTATTISSKQCKKLQKVFLQTILGKMGIVRTIPPLIAIAPTYLGGLGVFSIELAQLLGHLNLILLHGHDSQSMTGKLLRISLEYYALEAGLPGDPLQLPFIEYATPNTWIGHTLSSLRQYEIIIKSDVAGLEQWRQGDVFIMEKMRMFFSGPILGTINKVRLYLKVVTLSDLLVADGTGFSIDLVQGHRNYLHPTPSSSRYNWPSVPVPTRSERDTWWHGISLVFDISLALSRTIPPPTGPWKSLSIQHSRWLYSSRTQSIYEYLTRNEWMEWAREIGGSSGYATRSSTNLFIKSHSVFELPADTQLISVTRSGEKIRISHKQGIDSSSDEAEPHDTVQSPDHTGLTSRHNFVYHLRIHNGIVVSDGSYKDGHATFAFLAQPIHHQCDIHQLPWDSLLYKTGCIIGSDEDTNAYRAELAGILAAIEFTNKLCHEENILDGTCTLYCDNKGALSAAFGSKRPHPKWSSYDLVWKIRQALKTSEIQWKYKHVYGHQDKSKTFQSLDFIAQGNVIVDHLASHFQPGSSRSGDSYPMWTPVIQGTVVGGSVESQITHRIFKPLMIERWTKLFQIPQGRYTVDWELFFRSLRTQRKQIRIFWTKYNARILPVGTNLKRRLHADSDICPCCGEQEDHGHIMRCSHPVMEAAFQDGLETIQQFVQKNTDMLFSQNLVILLKLFRNGTFLADEDDDFILENISIGSRAFFAGLWSTGWRDKYDHHLRATHSPRNSMTWMAKLINKVQQLPYDMWTARNQVLHQSDNRVTQQQHKELDEMIDIIFLKKPHTRFMAHCDNQYFQKHDKEQIKKMSIRRKTNWVAGANLILVKYERTTTVQTARFQSFFQWDRG
jgi:hypothetical protein